MSSAPAAAICPGCGEIAGYVFEDGHWQLDGEWWVAFEFGIDYACTRLCLRELKRQRRLAG